MCIFNIGTHLCYWLKGFPVTILDKSRAAQLKARRKSSIGARGSPETNSLIRFMAQQKIKSASSCQIPEVRCFSSDTKNQSLTNVWLLPRDCIII